ncbi:MAG: type II toxin-antitoxin system RelE/ParE family toxin [Planctomycetota bacterium]|nr:MAG: type II toxin-antitoxin system RelE/ParE family toxin [Planctomycetota bacterium]
MPRALWTPQARADLKQLAKYIAKEGQRPIVAERLVDEIRSKCDEYAARPDIGARHPQLPEELRVFVHSRYVVVYEPGVDGMTVLRIVDGARDFARLFR